MSVVLVYRDRLFFPSEGFILAQAQALKRYEAFFLGTRRERGLQPPPDRTILLCDDTPYDRLNEIRFKVFKRIPKRFSSLSSLRPKLLHAHFGPDGLRALPIARTLGLPLVVTFHGFDATVSDEALRASGVPAFRAYVRNRGQLVRNGNLFLAVSGFLRDRLLNMGFPSNRVRVHYIGVDVNRFKPDPVAPREPILLFVGRHAEQKGILDFVQVAARVQARLTHVQAVALGDGPLAAEAKALAARAGAKISWPGMLPPEQVVAWMRRSTVLCGPSRKVSSGAEEALGLAFVEAQATGLPVVSYATGGVGEAVLHDRTGYLVRHGDVDALANSASLLFERTDLWCSLSNNAVQHVRARFDLERQTRLLEDLYDEVHTENLRGSSSGFVDHP